MSSEKAQSRLVGKSLERNPDSGEVKELHVDMRLQQRDSPETEWHIGDIAPDRDFVLLRRRDGATVGKSIKKLITELNTPGSPWAKKNR